MNINGINIKPLLKAHSQLANALPQVKTELERAGAIQYFEFCYELCWKTLRKLLLARGKIDVNSPKMVFREAALENFIDDPEIWFGFIEKRNLTTHTYEEEVAAAIYAILPDFLKELTNVIERIKNLQE